MILKMDGERGPSDSGQFTVIVSGGPLSPSPAHIRSDGHVLEDCLRKVITDYAHAVWPVSIP